VGTATCGPRRGHRVQDVIHRGHLARQVEFAGQSDTGGLKKATALLGSSPRLLARRHRPASHGGKESSGWASIAV